MMEDNILLQILSLCFPRVCAALTVGIVPNFVQNPRGHGFTTKFSSYLPLKIYKHSKHELALPVDLVYF